MLQNLNIISGQHTKFAGPWPRACQIIDFWKGTISKHLCNYLSFLFQIPSKNEQFSRYGFRNNPFQDNGSEMDSEMSTCSCFLLKQLFLVQKTAHARGAVREPRAMVIGSCLPMGGHLFLNNLLRPFFHSKLQFWTKHVSQMDPK